MCSLAHSTVRSFLLAHYRKYRALAFVGIMGASFVACTSSQLTRAARILPIGYSHNVVDDYDVDDFFLMGFVCVLQHLA
jgi:hypothetical protein